jgi:hypothetical protein
MKRLRTLGLCLLTVLTVSAVAAATASAEAPEYGRCVRKGVSGGSGFKNSTCTNSTISKAKYEWIPGAGAKAKFTSAAKSVYSAKYHRCAEAISQEELAIQQRAQAEGEPEPEKAELLRRAAGHENAAKDDYLRAGKGKNRASCEVVIDSAEEKTPVKIVIRTTPALTRVTCAQETGAGEFTGAKSVNLTMTLTECADMGAACQSPSAQEGEIVTQALQGELGVISVTTVPHTETIRTQVGIALSGAEGTTVAEFRCGESAFVVTGSAIREVPTGKMVEIEAKNFLQFHGYQEPENFFEQPVGSDVLETSINGEASVPSGLALKSDQIDEEALEVNTTI